MPESKNPRGARQPLSATLQEQLLTQFKMPGGPRRVAEKAGVHVATVRSAAVGDLLHPATIQVLTAYLGGPMQNEGELLNRVLKELLELRAEVAPLLAERATKAAA